MNDSGLHDILPNLVGQRLLVLGDVMLDEYLMGSVSRLSPEAPVPVVAVLGRRHVPGGAANTAANAAGLGARVLLLGVVGDDEAGRRLRAALEGQGISTAGLLVDPGRPTTTKTRIVAQSQQVARLDHEQRRPLCPELQERLLGLIEEHLAGVAAAVVADYAKGVVSVTVAQRLIGRARTLGKVVVVDPKGADAARYRGASVVKPNLAEAAVLLRREVDSAGQVQEAGRRLLEMLDTQAVLLTCGAAGMWLCQRGGAAVHIEAEAREVYDVTGAGDTVAATLAVALAAGAGLA
jgi:D-beta-D-heptose 7-phosphate kinase/D-beta-D-heptose 1-phosphate adenosyltransferase